MLKRSELRNWRTSHFGLDLAHLIALRHCKFVCCTSPSHCHSLEVHVTRLLVFSQRRFACCTSPFRFHNSQVHVARLHGHDDRLQLMAHFCCLIMHPRHSTHSLSVPHSDRDVPRLVAFKNVHFPPFLQLNYNSEACHINDRERIVIARTMAVL